MSTVQEINYCFPYFKTGALPIEIATSTERFCLELPHGDHTKLLLSELKQARQGMYMMLM